MLWLLINHLGLKLKSNLLKDNFFMKMFLEIHKVLDRRTIFLAN